MSLDTTEVTIHGDALGMSDPTTPIMHIFEDKATVVVPSPQFGKSGDLFIDDKISLDVSLDTAKGLIGRKVRVVVAVCEEDMNG